VHFTNAFLHIKLDVNFLILRKLDNGNAQHCVIVDVRLEEYGAYLFSFLINHSVLVERFDIQRSYLSDLGVVIFYA